MQTAFNAGVWEEEPLTREGSQKVLRDVGFPCPILDPSPYSPRTHTVSLLLPSKPQCGLFSWNLQKQETAGTWIRRGE